MASKPSGGYYVPPDLVSDLSSQLSTQEEAAGRACYEGFHEAMAPWLPYPPDWDGQAATVKRGWVAAAKAVQAQLRGAI